MSVSKKILLLEDDPNLGAVIEEHLKLNGYSVKRCYDGEEGATAFAQESYDLCLVDIMMPKKDGFTFVREVRAFDTQTPIIFLTAKSLQEDRIEGFKIGCDDYITKPFSIEELELRIQVSLRRTAAVDNSESNQIEFKIASFQFNSDRRTLTSSDSDRKLTPKEAELLRMLCLHMNKTLPRETALKEIWGDDGYFSGRSMDVFVSKLRNYLQKDGSVELLSVHGKGLRLVVD